VQFRQFALSVRQCARPVVTQGQRPGVGNGVTEVIAHFVAVRKRHGRPAIYRVFSIRFEICDINTVERCPAHQA